MDLGYMFSTDFVEGDKTLIMELETGDDGLSDEQPTNKNTKQAITATKQIDENSMPINYEAAVIYVCPACNEEFHKTDTWRAHMYELHQFNTQQGLNFEKTDNLLAQCLECNKMIKMHSMDNLFKHKIGHLPFGCLKCIFCSTQFKRKPGLMHHLRMQHKNEVIFFINYLAKETDENKKDINGNEQDLTAFLDDAQSRSSSHLSGETEKDDAFEDYIHYICPQCGTECDTQEQWSQHIDLVHDFGSAKGLNFKDQREKAQCRECKEKISKPYTIQQLQQHKFSHLSNVEWMRCKLCDLAFSENKMIQKHLQQCHRLTDTGDTVGGNDDECQEYKSAARANNSTK